MLRCPDCGREMRVLFSSTYCPAGCDKRKAAKVIRRKTVTVGRAPDFWPGAAHWLRAVEGRPVQVILDADDVPLEAVVHSWVTVKFSSAPDFDPKARSLADAVQERLRTHDRWVRGLPASKKADVEFRMARDEVLLIIR